MRVRCSIWTVVANVVMTVAAAACAIISAASREVEALPLVTACVAFLAKLFDSVIQTVDDDESWDMLKPLYGTWTAKAAQDIWDQLIFLCGVTAALAYQNPDEVSFYVLLAISAACAILAFIVDLFVKFVGRDRLCNAEELQEALDTVRSGGLTREHEDTWLLNKGIHGANAVNTATLTRDDARVSMM